MEDITDDSLSTLSQLGQDLFDAELEVLTLQAKLKQAVKVRDNIQNTEIPEFLMDVGITEFATDKVKVKLDDILRVSPVVANRPLVLQKLEEDGSGGLIKSQVTIAFNRGEEEKAAELIKELQSKGMTPKQERKVEPSTLKKYVKDKLAKGDAIDMELFGVKQFKQAKFVDGKPEAPVFEGE
jgi:hypothetical protein